MKDGNIFYVYEHWRPDTGACFYVGKGKDKRAWDMKGMRNRHHMAITSKLTALGFCVDVRIICRDMLEENAFNLEIERIAFYGVENLSNMTGGGDGLKNPSKETREKISKSQKARFQQPGVKEKMSQINKGRITSDATKKKLSLIFKGKKHLPETIELLRKKAKFRKIPQSTREAQKLAVTGKKRPPFTEETRKKMSDASKVREQRRREARAS